MINGKMILIINKSIYLYLYIYKSLTDYYLLTTHTLIVYLIIFARRGLELQVGLYGGSGNE